MDLGVQTNPWAVCHRVKCCIVPRVRDGQPALVRAGSVPRLPVRSSALVKVCPVATPACLLQLRLSHRFCQGVCGSSAKGWSQRFFVVCFFNQGNRNISLPFPVCIQSREVRRPAWASACFSCSSTICHLQSQAVDGSSLPTPPRQTFAGFSSTNVSELFGGTG